MTKITHSRLVRQAHTLLVRMLLLAPTAFKFLQDISLRCQEEALFLPRPSVQQESSVKKAQIAPPNAQLASTAQKDLPLPSSASLANTAMVWITKHQTVTVTKAIIASKEQPVQPQPTELLEMCVQKVITALQEVVLLLLAHLELTGLLSKALKRVIALTVMPEDTVGLLVWKVPVSYVMKATSATLRAPLPIQDNIAVLLATNVLLEVLIKMPVNQESTSLSLSKENVKLVLSATTAIPLLLSCLRYAPRGNTVLKVLILQRTVSLGNTVIGTASKVKMNAHRVRSGTSAQQMVSLKSQMLKNARLDTSVMEEALVLSNTSVLLATTVLSALTTLFLVQ